MAGNGGERLPTSYSRAAELSRCQLLGSGLLSGVLVGGHPSPGADDY